MTLAEQDAQARELRDIAKRLDKLEATIERLTAKAPEPVRYHGTWPNKVVTAAEWNEAYAPDAESGLDKCRDKFGHGEFYGDPLGR